MLSIPEETEEPISEEEYMESEPFQVLQQRHTDMPTDSPNPDPSSHPVPMVSHVYFVGNTHSKQGQFFYFV